MGGSKAGGLPHPSLSLPSPFPFPLSFQTNQWEVRSDPVRGKFPGFPPQIPAWSQVTCKRAGCYDEVIVEYPTAYRSGIVETEPAYNRQDSRITNIARTQNATL